MAEIIVTNENFEKEVLSSSKPVLVDFWATWCGPCQMLAPVIEEIANENSSYLKVCTVNVDDCPELAAKYSVASIPTVIYFRDGKPFNMSVGFKSKQQIMEIVK